MATRRFTVAPVTDGAGNATALSPFLSGRVTAIHYVKDPGAPAFAAGVDFTITVNGTGESLWTQVDVNASASVYPRSPMHSGAGVAALYAAGGTAVQDLIRVSRDQIKIVIAQGGSAKTGVFNIVVEG